MYIQIAREGGWHISKRNGYGVPETQLRHTCLHRQWLAKLHSTKTSYHGTRRATQLCGETQHISDA